MELWLEKSKRQNISEVKKKMGTARVNWEIHVNKCAWRKGSVRVVVCTILPGRGRATCRCGTSCALPTSLVLRLLKESRVYIDLRSLLDQPLSTARQLHLLVGHP